MENENSVCFIAKIKEINPIEGADKIELATINGWTSVVQKNIHKEGDLILCITTDAVIPEGQANQWGVTNYLRKGNRVRTVKLKGVYSECILIPLKDVLGSPDKAREGSDMMNLLGIFKYEPPAIIVQEKSGRKHKYHQNPNFHVYYKFPNYKNVPGIFTEEDDVVVTRKIHGTNARYGIVKKTKISLWSKFINFFKRDPWFEYEYIYGSHNVEKGSDSQGFYDTDVWRTIAEKMNLKEKLWTLIKTYYTPEIVGEGFILYGEIFGPGIQKHYDYNEKELKFNAFDIKLNEEYLEDSEFQSICIHGLAVNTVHYLHEGKYSDELLTKWNNDKIESTNIPHEGVVIKCVTGDRKKIAKVVSPDYLIYNEKHNGTDSH